MSDLDDVASALRAYAGATIVATTDLIDMAATVNGFTRLTGSFIDDKFRRGMEIVSSGFVPAADNIHSIITSVSPLEIRAKPFVITVTNNEQKITRPALVADASAPNRLLTAGLPSMHTFENEAPLGLTAFVPIDGIPYYEEELSPATSRPVGFPMRGAWIETEADYIFKIHGLAGVGSSALRKYAAALKTRFRPGTIIPVGTEYAIMMDGETTDEGSILQTTTGPVLVLTLPWHIRTRE